MMRYIIYIGVIQMPDKNAAAQRANAFSSIIRENGYSPIVIGLSLDRSAKQDIWETKNDYKGCTYYSMKYPSSSKEWLKTICSIYEIKKIIKMYGVENVEAIIAMDYYSIALLKLMYFCKKNEIKFIIDAVDWFAKSNDPFPRNIVKNVDTFLRMHWINKKTHFMITISRYLHDYYKKWVPNIVEIPGIAVHNKPKRAQYKCKESIRTLAFVGSPGKKCEKEKIDWIIKSVCELNKDKVRLKFHIAGIDKDTLFLNRKDIASLQKFDDSVICYGRIAHSECLNLVSACDFSVIVRENNLLSNAGFPTKLGESYKCGTPVLVTPTSNICEYIPPSHGIIAANCSEIAVRSALQKISEMTDKEIEWMHGEVDRNNPLDSRYYSKELSKLLCSGE